MTQRLSSAVRRRPCWALMLLCAWGMACHRKEIVAAFPETFVGVGLELKIEEAWPIVVRALEGGSAQEAGVQAGDRVTAVDGKGLEGLSLGDVVMKLRGQPGTQVRLSVEREGHSILIVIVRKKMAKGPQDYRPE